MNGLSYQEVLKKVFYLLAGVGAAAVFFGLITDGFSVVSTPLRALIGTVTVGIIWLAWELFIRIVEPRWNGGTRLKELVHSQDFS
jgi:hypothetical protein